MRCPKCKTVNLQALNSAVAYVGTGALPQRCPRCRGFWVRGSTIFALHESGIIDELDAIDEDRPEPDRRTGLCPEAHGILSRARVAWQNPYYLERCSKCGGLWLDAGEWQRLVKDNLIDHLDEIWAPEWRRKLWQQQEESQQRERLGEKLGDDVRKKLESLAEILVSHPERNRAVAFLLDVLKSARKKDAT